MIVTRTRPEPKADIALLLPPLGNLTQPYCSTAYLAGFLRERGHRVLQCDFGIKAADLMLTPQHLELMRRRVTARLAAPGLDRRRRGRLLASDLAGPDTASRILEAKAILRDPQRFYRPKDYRFAVSTVLQALGIISAAHDLDNVILSTMPRGERFLLESIVRLTGDPDRNPFLEILRDQVLPAALPTVPPVVGLSIAFTQQILPGYTLARLIKETSPATHVVMGGAALVQAEPRLREDPRAFDFVDSYIFGEGETPLKQLLDIVRDGRTGPGASSRLFLKSQAGTPSRNDDPGCEREAYNDLPPADYTGLNLDDYLSPEPVFLLANARGCYWNKCAFCNVSLAFKSGFQKRSADRLERDLHSLRERHHARFVFFSDDGMTTARCREIARISRAMDPPLTWQTMVRFEKGFNPELLPELRDGGCRLLAFGFESAVQRVLDLMNKGTRADNNRRIIRDVHAAGIAVYLHALVGFPGETREEARATIDFLTRARGEVASVGFHHYFLVEASPVQKRPADFGIARLRVKRRRELALEYRFETSSGLSRSEAGEVYRQGLAEITRAYPASAYFFDNLFSAHGLLYLDHYGAPNLGTVFAPPALSRGLPNRRPRLGPRVRTKRISKDQVLLYNPDTGRDLKLPPGLSAWLPLFDGARTITDLLRERPDPRSGRKAAELLPLAAALFQEGFIELDGEDGRGP